MILSRFLSNNIGSIVKVDLRSRSNYSLTGVLQKVVKNKIILRMERTGNDYGIRFIEIKSIEDPKTAITVQNLEDGHGKTLKSQKKEVI